MARHVSVASAIEKNRIASQYAYIALLAINVIDQETGAVTETLYVARNSEDVVFKGNTYEAGSFDFEITHAANSAPDVKLSVVDFTQTIQEKMESYSGGVGFKVWVMIVNSSNLDQPSEFIEQFYVLSAQVSGYKVVWTIGSRNPLRVRFPRRIQSRDRCQWQFAGTECGYEGLVTTCDYTLQGPNGCGEKANSRRYGGQPGLRPRGGL